MKSDAAGDCAKESGTLKANAVSSELQWTRCVMTPLDKLFRPRVLRSLLGTLTKLCTPYERRTKLGSSHASRHVFPFLWSVTLMVGNRGIRSSWTAASGKSRCQRT